MISAQYSCLTLCKQSFVPHKTSLWKNLTENIQKSLLQTTLNSHYIWMITNLIWHFLSSAMVICTHHAWLRIGRSGLNEDLSSNLHVIPSPDCDYISTSQACQCGFPVDHGHHYFYHCPSYQAERIILFNSI